MQLESFMLVDKSNNIIFACYSPLTGKDWNGYLERLVRLIPNWETEPPAYLRYADIVIGTQVLGEFRIVVTAPLTSDLATEPVMRKAVEQFEQIVKFACKDNLTQVAIVKREHYINLQLLVQEEVSADGNMRFVEQDEFESITDF